MSIKSEVDEIFSDNYEDYLTIAKKIFKNSINTNKNKVYKVPFIRVYDEDIIFELVSQTYEYILNGLTLNSFKLDIINNIDLFRSVVINYIDKQCNWYNQTINKKELEYKAGKNLELIDEVYNREDEEYDNTIDLYQDFLDYYESKLTNQIDKALYELIIINKCYTGPKISKSTNISKTYSGKILKNFKNKMKKEFLIWKKKH